MQKILNIDKEMSSYIKDIILESDKLHLNVLCEFKLDKNNIKDIPWETFHYPGIYLFEIKNNNRFKDFDSWVSNFKSEWMNPKYVKCFTPNLTKKRMQAHKTLNEWIPIYIGKSKSIESRVHEHIFKELKKTTFALKLNSRDNLYNEIFRLRTIKIDLTNYDSIMPLIESTLRDKINPILGRQ